MRPLFRRAAPAARRASVLRLGEGCAEWLADGDGGGYGRAAVAPGEPGSAASPAPLAEAAAAARAAAGDRARSCTLALGSAFLRQRMVELPPLAARERSGVFLRKAANLIDAPTEDTLFSAIAASSAATAGSAVQCERWLVVALRRSFLSALLHELAQHGVRVTRVVGARQAPLNGLGSSDAAIAVEVGPDEVVVSLVADGRLLAQNVIAGHFERTPATARTLMTEVRSQEAYWRKTHRGARVGRVVLLGLPSERVELFEHALHTALSTVDVVPLDVGVHDEADARRTVLAACRSAGPFEVDLTYHAPPRPHKLAALVAAPAFAVLVLGAFGYARVTDELAQVERDSARLHEQAEQNAERAQASQSAQRRFDHVKHGFLRVHAAHEAGWKLEDLFADTLAAFGADGALRSLATGLAAPEAEIVLSGWTDGDPWACAQRVDAIAAALVAAPTFARCRAEPDVGSLDLAGDTTQPLVFKLRAQRQEMR